MKVNRAYYALLPILKSQSVLKAQKIKIYKTLTRPDTHAAESWTLSKGNAKWLAAFERKVLRLGELNYMKIGKKQYNKDLMQLFGDLDTFSLIRISQLNWTGHVNRKVSQIFNNNPKGH
jgi:hypothetical protein